MRAFFAQCPLIGEPLDALKWPFLENVAKGDARLDFLISKDEVVEEEPNDWELKCFGLKEVKPGAGVFVAGLNRIFYEKQSLELTLLRGTQYPTPLDMNILKGLTSQWRISLGCFEVWSTINQPNTPLFFNPRWCTIPITSRIAGFAYDYY